MGSAGMDLDKGQTRRPGGDDRIPGMSMVRANIEAFADAAAAGAPYPVRHQEMIDNISAFEAISKSAESGEIVTVER